MGGDSIPVLKSCRQSPQNLSDERTFAPQFGIEKQDHPHILGRIFCSQDYQSDILGSNLYIFCFNYLWKSKSEIQGNVVNILKLDENYEEINEPINGIFFANFNYGQGLMRY